LRYNLYSRVDDTNTTLQTVVERTLTTATGKNLGLDNHVVVTWGEEVFSTECEEGGEHTKVEYTNGTSDSLSLLGGASNLSLGDTNAILY